MTLQSILKSTTTKENTLNSNRMNNKESVIKLFVSELIEKDNWVINIIKYRSSIIEMDTILNMIIRMKDKILITNHIFHQSISFQFKQIAQDYYTQIVHQLVNSVTPQLLNYSGKFRSLLTYL